MGRGAPSGRPESCPVVFGKNHLEQTETNVQTHSNMNQLCRRKSPWRLRGKPRHWGAPGARLERAWGAPGARLGSLGRACGVWVSPRAPVAPRARPERLGRLELAQGFCRAWGSPMAPVAPGARPRRLERAQGAPGARHCWRSLGAHLRLAGSDDISKYCSQQR